jgi:hypothetical protein
MKDHSFHDIEVLISLNKFHLYINSFTDNYQDNLNIHCLYNLNNNSFMFLIWIYFSLIKPIKFKQSILIYNNDDAVLLQYKKRYPYINNDAVLFLSL